MKRSAESQLTRENLDDEDDNSSEGPREFQRASQRELAKRVIKPLPSRRGGSGSPGPSLAPPSALPAFGSTAKPSSTTSDTVAPTLSTTTLPKLGAPVLPPLPAGAFTFKPPAVAGSSPFALPTSTTTGAAKPTLPAFVGSGVSPASESSATAITGGSGGFSFKLPTTTTTTTKEASTAPTNGTKSSKEPSGGLPPFNAFVNTSSKPLFSFGPKPPGNEKQPSGSSSKATPAFSFDAPASSSGRESASKTATTSGLKPPSPSAPSGKATASAVAPSKPIPPPPNMTATAKSMSSIFASMTSESPPRPTLPGFKGPNGGITISPEKSSTTGISKSKSGSFSFGGGIPKKQAPSDAQAKPKVDKGKGKATSSTGTFGLRSFSPNSPIDDVIEEERVGPYPNGPFPNGPNPNNEDGPPFRRGPNDPPPGGLDAGDFDPALNDDGSPTRKPQDHPEHQEAYEGDQEMKYWIHLRGLNTSFLREIIRRQREDPFTDLSSIFKSYKEFRKEIIAEMVEWLRANGKGEGTESADEDSDSGDEEMEYEQGEQGGYHQDDYMEGTDEEQLHADIRQQQAQQQREEEEDGDKTPPGGIRLPKAPVGGLYMFGGKSVSSFSGAGGATATTGIGFKPSGAAAEFKPPPPARYSFKATHPSPVVSSQGGFAPAAPSTGPPSTSTGGFTPSQPWTKPFGSSTTKPPIAGGPSTASSSTSDSGGFVPMDTSGPQLSLGSLSSTGPLAPTPASSTGSGFTFKPSGPSAFTFSKPPAPASAPKEAEASPKSPPAASPASKTSTFPGFGPITGGPSGSPFGTKPAASASPKSPTSPTAFGSSSGFSFGSSGGTAFGGFGTSAGASGSASSGGDKPAVGPFGSSTTSKLNVFGSTGDPPKPTSPFGAFGGKPSGVWSASPPEAAKPGGIFGVPPASTAAPLFGSTSSGVPPSAGSIFGAKPTSGSSPFGSGSVFGGPSSTSAFGGASSSSASAFGGGSTSAFGSGLTTTSFGDPSKGSQSQPQRFGGFAASNAPAENSSQPGDSSDGRDELEGDDDEATTPKATPKALPAFDAPRGGVANPWAPPPATSSIAPAAGGPFKFGMGSKPAAADPDAVSRGPSLSRPSGGFSFADPPSGFKLPSAGTFSFADPPKSSGGFSFADPPKSTAGATSAFMNPFSSPPKTGTLPGFGPSTSSAPGGFSFGFGSSGAATAGGGTPTTSNPRPSFGGTTTPSGTFSFGAAPPNPAAGPFFSSSAVGGTSHASTVAGGSGAPGDTGLGSTTAGSSQESDVAPEGGAAVGLGEDKFDQPGPGEEMEESLFTVRGKVMKFAGLAWIDMGIGQIRLYRHKETGARRVFARNSKSGRIILNFAPFAKMEPKIDEQKAKFMRMTAMDDGKLVKILVKLKEEKDAAELVGVLQKEVEGLS